MSRDVVTLYATERLPQPLAVTAPVTVDFANMALVVRRPDAAGGSEKLLWREAHQALVQAEESGWPSSTRFVWGSAPGNYQFAHAASGPNLTLLFAFAVGTTGAQVYAAGRVCMRLSRLTSRLAIFWVSRSNTGRDRPSRVGGPCPGCCTA